MTDEEKEAIEYFKETYWYFGEEIKANVDILLNLIDKQQKEIKELKEQFNIVDHECSRLEKIDIEKDLEIEKLTTESTEWESRVYELQDNIAKKDKIIDLMCEQLAGLAIWNNEKQEPNIYMSEEEVKQYFEKEASKDD